MKSTVIWEVRSMLCSELAHRRFGGKHYFYLAACFLCLNFGPKDGVNTFLRNVFGSHRTTRRYITEGGILHSRFLLQNSIKSCIIVIW
jgi:hypothetical protein